MPAARAVGSRTYYRFERHDLSIAVITKASCDAMRCNTHAADLRMYIFSDDRSESASNRILSGENRMAIVSWSRNCLVQFKCSSKFLDDRVRHRRDGPNRLGIN